MDIYYLKKITITLLTIFAVTGCQLDVFPGEKEKDFVGEGENDFVVTVKELNQDRQLLVDAEKKIAVAGLTMDYAGPSIFFFWRGERYWELVEEKGEKTASKNMLNALTHYEEVAKSFLAKYEEPFEINIDGHIEIEKVTPYEKTILRAKLSLVEETIVDFKRRVHSGT